MYGKLCVDSVSEILSQLVKLVRFDFIDVFIPESIFETVMELLFHGFLLALGFFGVERNELDVVGGVFQGSHTEPGFHGVGEGL